MKGVIVQCLRDLIRTKFGTETWSTIMKAIGQDPDQLLLAAQDIDDEVVLRALASTCTVLGISLEQAADAFGQHWMCEFAPKIYRSIYDKAHSAKGFLLMMDDVHVSATRAMPNARPPRFGYTWENDKTLIMTYQSPRALIDIMAGLARGIGAHFKERLEVTKLSSDRLKIVFGAS